MFCLGEWESRRKEGAVTHTELSLRSLTAPAADLFPSPCKGDSPESLSTESIDRCRERTITTRWFSVRPQKQLHCLAEREPAKARAPRSPDRNYAEHRKPMELVPPSGTESNCWFSYHQQLILLSPSSSSHLSILSPLSCL